MYRGYKFKQAWHNKDPFLLKRMKHKKNDCFFLNHLWCCPHIFEIFTHEMQSNKIHPINLHTIPKMPGLIKNSKTGLIKLTPCNKQVLKFANFPTKLFYTLYDHFLKSKMTSLSDVLPFIFCLNLRETR